MWEWLVSEVLLPFLGLVVTAAIAWAVARFTAWTGIQIEARHREALHSALMTGVRMMLEKFGPAATERQVVNGAIDYAHRSVPDAIKKLDPPSDVLASLATSKLEAAKAAPVSLGAPAPSSGG